MRFAFFFLCVIFNLSKFFNDLMYFAGCGLHTTAISFFFRSGLQMFVDDTDRQRIYDTKKKTEFNGPRTNAMTSFDRYSSHLMIARQYFIFLHVESALKLLLPTYSIT